MGLSDQNLFRHSPTARGYTIDLTTQELSQLKQLTGAAGDSDAAGHAVREFLRLCQLRELKGVSGKFEFEDRGEELESLELGEAPFPK